MPTSVSVAGFRRLRRERERASSLRAPVDAQQRQPARPRPRRRARHRRAPARRSPGSLRPACASVTRWPCALTTSPVPYSTDFASAAKGALRSGKGAKALAIAPVTARRCPPSAWSYSMVKPRSSPSRICARTEKYFRPCMPLTKKLSSCSALFSILRPASLLLLVEQGRQREVGILDAEGLDLEFAVRRRPARAVRGVVHLRHHLARQADADAGRRVGHHGPAVFASGGCRRRPAAPRAAPR